MIDQNDPRLTDYVLGELSATEANEIEQAIQNSPELEAAVEEIRSTVGLLGDAYTGGSHWLLLQAWLPC
jgi:anti-sigma factor RsiW